MSVPLPPGSALGVLGTGQLGRMFADAAHALGYRVWVLGPDADGSPAGQVADHSITAEYDDPAALDELARHVQVATVEFENVPRAALDRLAQHLPTRPGAHVLHTCQHRLREKLWLHDNEIPHAPFVPLATRAELDTAVRITGFPAILKSAAFGYDGKGQAKLNAPTDLDAAWNAVVPPAALKSAVPGEPLAVLEQFIPFVKEVSVIVARNTVGQMRVFPVCENDHSHHVLAVTRIPARIPDAVAAEAQDLARHIAERMEVVGLITAEFFLTADGRLLVNELAPRPHNSGHPTIDCCNVSQFDLHVRAITGHPLPEISLTTPAVMANLLGDLWEQFDADEPNWSALRALPGAHLHLYGKAIPARRRKMAHLTVTGELSPELDACLVKLGRDQVFIAP
jgi:5-(carboxyamino)imidazole ribonucleotide synthase